MILHTCQSPAAFERLEREGILRADGRRADRDFRAAYAWMRAQVRRRVPGARGRPLLWAWVGAPPEGVGAPGEVCLTLEVDPSRVLLSDFDAWHSVLNRGFLALTEAELEAFEARWERCAAAGGDAWSELRALIEPSWERVFDLEAMAMPWGEEPPSPRVIQAVLEEIRWSEVQGVRRLPGPPTERSA